MITLTHSQFPIDVVLRDGTLGKVVGKGPLGGVLVVEVNGVGTCRNQNNGRWRWDDVDDPRDIVEIVGGDE